MKLIIISNVASTADRFKKVAQNKLPPWGFEPTSASSLDQIVCQGDLIQLSKLLH